MTRRHSAEELAHNLTRDPGFLERSYPNPAHCAMLEASGISLSEAWKRGIIRVDDITLLDDGKGFRGKGIPAESTGGLLFPHFTLLGGRALQFRPDKPYVPANAKSKKEKPRKYDWELNSGNIISVGLNTAERIAARTGKRLVIVEGTKQAIAADIYAPDDCVVIGIQGIQNWQSQGDVHPDIDTLAARYEDIVIIPDGDTATNPAVWEGANRLISHLKKAHNRSAKTVTIDDGKSGIDDYLGARDETLRALMLSNLIASAGALPEAPVKKAARRTLAYTVDWDGAQIGRETWTFDEAEGKDKRRFEAAANFAARIYEILEIHDDLNDPEGKKMAIRYRLEVVTEALTWAEKNDRREVEARGEEWEDPRRVHRIPGWVDDAELPAIDAWLRRGGARVKAAGADRAGGRFSDADVARAIEAFSMTTATRTQQALTRTGWVEDDDGMQTYCSLGNGINADGNTDAYVSQIDFSVTLRAPETEDAEDRAREGFYWPTRALEMPDQKNPGGRMARATGIAFFGTICWALAGLPVKHSLYVHAPKGSGKSTFFDPLAASFDDDGLLGAMASAGSTGLALGDEYKHRHNFVVIADDVIRERTEKRKEEAAEGGLDTLARIAFDGPVKHARKRLKQTVGGDWMAEGVEKSWPTVVGIGEQLPQKGSSSGVNRMYGTRYAGVCMEEIEDEQGIEDLRAFWGYFLQEVAALRDEGVKVFVDGWREWKRERSTEIAARLGHRLGSKDEIARRSGLLATVQGGYLLAARVLGIDGEAQVRDDLLILEEAMLDWTIDSQEDREDGVESVLNALRTAVGTGDRFIVDGDATGGQMVLGRAGKYEGTEAFFIVPKVAVEALGRDWGTTDRLKRALTDRLLVPHTVPVKIGKATVRALAISREAWDGEPGAVLTPEPEYAY